MSESPYQISHALGQQIDSEPQFQPIFDAQQTQNLIHRYGEMPTIFSPEELEEVQRHAYHHNIPMYTGEFTFGEAIKQFGQGVFSGFTTFNVGKAPDNEYEAIARSIGHLVGFAPGMVAKPLTKVKALSGWAQKLASVKSAPMWAAEKIRKKAVDIAGPAMKTAAEGKAGAVSTVGKFLTGKKVSHTLEGAFDLGVASGISAWQGGINEILNATFHGAAAGAVFRSLGNYVNLGDEKATKLTRALAGSLYTGLQAEHRGATTPELVYEYLLGGFFGYGEAPYYKAGARKFMKDYYKKKGPNAELDITTSPELMGEKWTKLDKLEQKEVRKIIKEEVLGGGEVDDRLKMGMDLIQRLGYTDKYGRVTKESWEKLRETLREKPFEGLEVTPEGTPVKPAEQRLVKKISDLNLKLQKDKGRLAKIKSEMDIEDTLLKETGKKNEALYAVYEKQSERLTEDIARNQSTLDKLTKNIDDKAIISEGTKNVDSDMDPGDKTTIVRVGKPAERFTDAHLKDLYDIDVDPQTKSDLKLVIAKKVDDAIQKESKPQSGKTPDIDRLAEGLQKDLEVSISPEARGELKQLITRTNKGIPQRYMRITYEPEIKPDEFQTGRDEKIVFQPMYLDRPITKAGNVKDNIEPLKVFEDIYLKESGGQIDSKWGTFVHLDHMSMKNLSGQWKDYTLSEVRKNNPKEYRKALETIIKSMNSKDIGMYLFGGRGDADKLFFLKYHPKTNAKEGNSFFRASKMEFTPEYKAAYKMFRKQFPKIPEKTLKKMFKDAIKSNILYDMGVQGYSLTRANFDKMWKSTEKGEFIGNALEYNKRLQIPITPAWPGSKTLADKVFKNDKGYMEGKEGFNYALVKDVDLPPAHKEKLFNLLAEQYVEGTDGSVIGRRDVINFNNEDAGNPKSGQNKAFIISPDAEHGALLGKFMFHKASPELSSLMEKANMHYLIHNSSAKQRGTREVGTYTITPKGELKIDAPTYTLDPSHIKYSYSVKQSAEMYEVPQSIPKQWFSNLNSKVAFAPVHKDIIKDVFSETISKSYEGNADFNFELASYLKDPTPAKLNRIIKNLEQVGVPNLLEAINSNEGTKFADAAYEKLLKLNKEIAIEDARENGIKESRLNEYLQEIDDFNSVTNRMLQRAHKVAKGKDLKAASIYAHKWIRNYRLNVMKNYVMKKVASPKIGNSAAARMRPYDKALKMDLGNTNPFLKLLNKRDDIFFLDNDYRHMPLKTHLGGKWKNTTLGELWDAVQDPIAKKQFKGRESEVEEIFRAMVVRVPMDSISGAHALKFRGFTGINGHGVLIHPRAMRALGGADLDGDEAFVYFGGKDARNQGAGMKKEWKDAFEANKEEYVAYVSKDPTFKTKKGEPGYDYLSVDKYNKLSDSKKKQYVKFIPDPKVGFANRPDGKYPEDMTMEKLLTKEADANVRLAKTSKIAMYSPSVRLDVSENVVNSRQLMGGVVSMTQTMKNAHDLIANKKNGIDKIEFIVEEGKNKEPVDYIVEVKARTEKEWNDYSRRLSASMTAFTADPMDTGGTRSYDFYFKELHDSYFSINSVRRKPKDKKHFKALDIKDMDSFYNHFNKVQSDKVAHIYKLKNGLLKSVMDMNQALFGKNYEQGRVWNEKEIRDRLDFLEKMDPELLTNISAQQGKLLSEAPKWTDDIFNKISKEKVIDLYKEMNVMAKENKFLAGIMGRSSFTIPESQYVLKVLENNLHDPVYREALALDSNISRFESLFVNKDGKPNRLKYRRHENESPQEFVNNIRNLTDVEKSRVLDDVYHKAQDYMVNDIHDMVTLKRIVELYSKNKESLTPKRIREIFDEVEITKRSHSQMKKDRNDTTSFYEIRKNMTEKERAYYDSIKKKDKEITDKERAFLEAKEKRTKDISAELDQVQIDKKIRAYKETLSPVEKDLYDYLMLGTYNRNEMAQKGAVDLDNPEIKAEFIKKGARTSLTQVGWNSKSVSVRNIDKFIKDYMDISAKTFQENKTELKRALELSEKLEDIEVKVDNQDGPVKLFEKKSPEVKVEKYEEDLSGYIGLRTGKLNPKQQKVIDSLAEHLKYYENGKTLKLNDITRGMFNKDLNAMNFQDYKIMNEVFASHRHGTFAQRLFKEASPDMRQRFWMLFPEKVTQSMMKYDIEFIKSKGAFKTADGKWVQGWIRKPSWVLEGLMDWNGKLRDMAVDLGESLENELNTTLSFYVDAMPEGRQLRRIAVSEMELGNIKRILYGKSHPEANGGREKGMPERRNDAKGYADSYLKEIQGDSKDYKTAKPTGEAKRILEKTYNMVHPDGKKEKLTGYEVVKNIKKTYSAMNKRAHEIITGDPIALDPYRTGSFFNKDPNEPKLNWRKFIDDIENLYQTGQKLPTNIGIDGLRQIARSMMLDLAPTENMRKKLMKTKLSKTNKLDYDTYYPHIFGSIKAAKENLNNALKRINEDSSMSPEKKDLEAKKIMMRTHNLTGDWVDPNGELYDAYDRAAEQILLSKNAKEENFSWWNSNQKMGSMNSRNTHLPGWDIGRNSYETYLRNIGNTYFNQMNQIFSRHTIEAFKQRMSDRKIGHNWDLEKTGYFRDADGKKIKTSLLDHWVNYLKLYTSDAMGNPSIIPEKIFSDPAMKIKGTPYYWWADNRVKKKMEHAKKVILGEKKSEYPHLDKLMEKMDYATLNKWSTLEAKFELASLLAHPKSGVGNIFGGSMHTIQSAGLEYFKKGRSLKYLNKIDPSLKTMEDVDALVTSQGVIPEFLTYQFGIDPKVRKANLKDFSRDVGKKMDKSGKLDEVTFKELIKKHKVTKPLMDAASWFMSKPERILRRDAYMAHLVRAYEMFDGALDIKHPFLVEIAKKGVKATQFLYNAPYRPAFSRSALGRVMTRFQLWQWNAVRFRNDVAREAKLYGIAEGTPAFERFKRTLQADMLVFALGNAFAYSIFDTSMPAPYAWYQDTADWLFGNESERDRAFFGEYPTAIAPLKLVSPPVLRHPLAITKALYTGDWERFAHYHAYTMFPFGRIGKDFSPFVPNSLIDNPLSLVDKWTGIPLQRLSRESKKMRTGEGAWYPWSPHGAERKFRLENIE